jgi:hypothetical protein
MAKALLGHVGLVPDQLLVSDLRRLRARVVELEAEVERLRAVNEALTSRIAVSDDLLLTVPEAEPAYT